ncbi:hypothetical protein ES707_21842 [subsurface metagenome]
MGFFVRVFLYSSLVFYLREMLLSLVGFLVREKCFCGLISLFLWFDFFVSVSCCVCFCGLISLFLCRVVFVFVVRSLCFCVILSLSLCHVMCVFVVRSLCFCVILSLSLCCVFIVFFPFLSLSSTFLSVSPGFSLNFGARGKNDGRQRWRKVKRRHRPCTFTHLMRNAMLYAQKVVAAAWNRWGILWPPPNPRPFEHYTRNRHRRQARMFPLDFRSL